MSAPGGEAGAAVVTAGPPQGLRHGFSSLRHRDFAMFWSAAIVSNTGSWMQNVTVPFVIYAMTHSTTWLGVTAFASFFPSVVAGPIAGPMADRFPRRRVLLVTQTVQMLVAFSLWGFWVTGRATSGIILGHVIVSGLTGGINIASWQSFVPSLVPVADMLNAVRLNSIQFTAARAIGPALAGLVLARFGPATSFLVNAVTFLLVIAALAAVTPRPVTYTPVSASFMRQFGDGLRYVRRRRPLVLAVVTITITGALVSALVQLAPAFARVQFHTGKAGYGLLVAAYGAGTILGSVALAAHADRWPRSRMAMIGLFSASAATFGLALAPGFGLGLAALVLMGLAYVAITVSLNTSVQAQVEEAYRGRVVSLYLMGLTGGLPVGALILGRLADVAGMRTTIAISAGLVAAYAVLVTVRLGGLRSIDASVA